jgi:hypothetical protein
MTTVSQLLKDIERAQHKRDLPDLREKDGWFTRSAWKVKLHVGWERLYRIIDAAAEAGILEEGETYRARSDGQLVRTQVLRMDPR